MYKDPCTRCPNIQRNCIFQHNCTAVKAAFAADVHNGMVEIGRATHDRIMRAQK